MQCEGTGLVLVVSCLGHRISDRSSLCHCPSKSSFAQMTSLALNYVSSGDVWEEGSGDENAETWRPACIIYFRFCIEIPTVLKMEVHAVQERTLSI